MLKRERADCSFHYSNTRAISSWQEGPLHPHSFSPPGMIAPLNTHGDLLVSGSASDNTMYVWAVGLDKAVPLKRVGGGGISFVSWSPDSLKLFAATTNLVFRVWETCQWEPDRWTLATGRVVSAVWSPCSSLVLFAVSLEPVIYCLSCGVASSVFQSEDRRGATPLIDLTPVELDSGESKIVWSYSEISCTPDLGFAVLDCRLPHSSAVLVIIVLFIFPFVVEALWEEGRCELAAAIFQFRQFPLLVVTAYKPKPFSASVQEHEMFYECLSDCLHKIINPAVRTVVVGDFNVNLFVADMKVDLQEYTSSLVQFSRQKKDSQAKTLRIGSNNAQPLSRSNQRLHD
ncbi:hypothetical protein J6590_075528 [Homalodisca vitripennis]|nr:hypothetical protein J6590_075528 [Homalodisca vitripennis]